MRRCQFLVLACVLYAFSCAQSEFVAMAVIPASAILVSALGRQMTILLYRKDAFRLLILCPYPI
jgi:hypothetical protein